MFKASMTDEQKDRYKEKAKLRMQAYRKRQKEQGLSPKPKVKKKTRACKNAQRTEWRDAKRKQRKEMSSQTKRMINEKRRQTYALKKANVNVVKLSPEVNPEDEQPDFKSDSAKRKSTSGAIRVLPKSSKKFVQLVTTIIEKATPRRKDAFKKLNLNPKRLGFLEETSRSVKETLHKLKTKRNKKDNRLRQLVHQALICKRKLKTQLMKEMSLSRKVMNKLKGTEDYSRKVRCDKIHPDVVRNVAGFFQRSDIFRVIPVKLSLMKDLIIKKALESSRKTSYERYLKENEESKISFSAFVKLRPKNILPMDNHKYMQRKRQTRTARIKPIQDTRSTHCFRGVMPYVTLSRERSCFCTVCTGIDSGTCKYHKVTGDWSVSYMKCGIHSRGVYMCIIYNQL